MGVLKNNVIIVDTPPLFTSVVLEKAYDLWMTAECFKESVMIDMRKIDSNFFNRWQAERHYLKRPIIRSKLLAHGIYIEGKIVGGLLWATPHFTKKSNLFGYPGLLDKWEVLMLARFYLEDGCGIVASVALAESIGRSGGKGKRGSKRRGWRVQEDWVKEHPPPFPNEPFVPRLLISWSDTQWGHEGTIYKASGWDFWDETQSGGRRTGRSHWIDADKDEVGTEYKREKDGLKRCWIMRLGENQRAETSGKSKPTQEELFALEGI